MQQMPYKCEAQHDVPGGEKINTMTYNEMASSGVLFVNSKTACAMDYLHLAYLRLLRGRLAPGQEANVLELYHQGDSRLLHKQNTRDYLLHALEAFALAQRTPDEVVQFNLAYPAKHLGGLHKDFLFAPPRPVKALAFDGHCGIHRALVPGVDPKRTNYYEGKQPTQVSQRTSALMFMPSKGLQTTRSSPTYWRLAVCT